MQKTTKSTGGTSFHDDVFNASVNDLIQILGEPDYVDNSGEDKVNFEWEMETEDGEVFTVYSWKEYRPISKTEIIEWHIGGLSGNVTSKALDEIAGALNNL